ncbi:MAG: acyltransferase family protein [Nocardiaceae bacterium]|nr:acyltransferase family protein [Nocardiaceae bacterium]
MIELPHPKRVPAVRAAPGNRVDWVDIAKGLAMVLVVIYHVCLFMVARHLTPTDWNRLNGFLQPVRMPLFMLTSGLFAQKMIKMAWLPVLRTRVGLMIYLYVVWLFMFFVVHNLLPDEVRHRGYARASNLITGLYWPTNALWYLYAIAIFIVLAKLLRRAPIPVQLGLALVSAVWIQYDNYVRFPFSNFFEYFLYFLIGLHLKDLVIEIGRRASGALLVGGIASYAVFDLLKNVLHVPAFKVGVSIAGVATAVVISSMLVGTHVGAVLNKIGQNTLPIFLMFDMWIALWTWVLMQGPEFPGSPLVVTTLVVIYGLIMHRFLMWAHFRWLFELPRLPAKKKVAA